MAGVITQEAGRIQLGQARGRWVLAAAVLGSSMAFLDATVVNVALPTIGRELHTSLSGLQWTVTAYTLTLAGLNLLGGALGDRFGRRRVFLIGVIWFALASLICGVAPDIGVLIAARALQGIGGALLTPGSLAIIQSTFSPDDRPRAIGAWSGLGGVAGAIGPFLGGWIVGSIGWRWIFLINLPLAVAVVAVGLRHVPESRDPDARGRFDIAGSVLTALALAGLTDALIEAVGASMSASVRPARASAVSTDPAMSNRPRASGSRLSGTCRSPTATTATASGRLIRKIQRQPIEPTIQPPRNGPIAPATPPSPDQAPMARGRSSGLNVDWMMASEPGVSSAPPMPCSARAAMSTPMSGATPQISEASANQITPMRNTR